MIGAIFKKDLEIVLNEWNGDLDQNTPLVIDNISKYIYKDLFFRISPNLKETEDKPLIVDYPFDLRRNLIFLETWVIGEEIFPPAPFYEWFSVIRQHFKEKRTFINPIRVRNTVVNFSYFQDAFTFLAQKVSDKLEEDLSEINQTSCKVKVAWFEKKELYPFQQDLLDYTLRAALYRERSSRERLSLLDPIFHRSTPKKKGCCCTLV